ncbi:response regulator transcription factor [Lachnotalea glycerini]|jgi:two-component system, OmpR family, response regulator|uniref:Heme response regulator HssR n=1 Tax=Lachnotalea glycerini TaxID=1763509 RepID=A0A371JJL4_9FIRM|nr:response regulator transcription factor [Lachnotalea glycerini]RDY32935.1 DNA-binding response regulator [Lachnotalea glycerini]
MFTILVVEDDDNLRKLFCTVLNKNGYQTIDAKDGYEALDCMDKNYVDLLISDVMMPNMDGYELTRELRAAHYEIPILLITVKESFQDKQKGFLSGTDDYMVKPIDVNEMVLRVEALLRRAQIITERKLTIGSTILEYDTLTVYQNKLPILLPQKEFYLLYKLASYPNKIFTRQSIMDEIWGMDSESDERTVDVHVNRLRDRFKENQDFDIITVRGLGYKVVKKNV